jgi:hypothetical protein
VIEPQFSLGEPFLCYQSYEIQMGFH